MRVYHDKRHGLTVKEQWMQIFHGTKLLQNICVYIKETNEMNDQRKSEGRTWFEEKWTAKNTKWIKSYILMQAVLWISWSFRTPYATSWRPCTDARVNIVTKDLFKKYPNVEAMRQPICRNWRRILDQPDSLGISQYKRMLHKTSTHYNGRFLAIWKTYLVWVERQQM